MNLKSVICCTLIVAALSVSGCGPIQIPTGIPIPSDLPEFPTFAPPDDGGGQPTSPPEDGGDPPPPADDGQPTQDGSIPVTGDNPDGSIMLMYGLLALLGVVVLFGFMALMRRPDRPYRERTTDRRGDHE
jgi:hypothetical protein